MAESTDVSTTIHGTLSRYISPILGILLIEESFSAIPQLNSSMMA